MLHIGAFEAKNTLGNLLDRIERGEEVLITRHGKPVAQLVRPKLDTEAEKAAEVQAAFDRIRERAERLRGGRPAQPFDFEDFKRARDEGRP